MIKCEVIKDFTLKRFNELKNIKRKSFDTKGKLYIGDTFECDEDMVKYLTGNNDEGEVVVKVIEVEPEKTEIVIDNINNQPIGELQPKVKEAIEYLENKKSTKKKKSSKKGE